jgi:predicted RNase H-like nuclease
VEVAGVDGCEGGWLVARLDVASAPQLLDIPVVCRTFLDVLDFCRSTAIIAVDIPIGLPDSGPRAVDIEVRRTLGGHRASSVFPCPIRPVVERWDTAWLASPATRRAGYLTACELSARICGKKLSRQAFELLPKIRDVDDSMTPALQKQVIEIHPELCFWAMNGSVAVQAPKRKAEGHETRLGLLASSLGAEIRYMSAPRGAAPDDLADALAAAWSASRVFAGQAQIFPTRPELDRKGLRMEMTC